MPQKYHVPARTLRLLAAAAVVALITGYHAARAEAGPPVAPTLSWSSADAAGGPPPLAYASAAYDADNSTVVLFGGVTAAGTLNGTTWVWNGHSWSAPDTSAEPPARQMASMAFDPTLHRLVLFGGQAPNGTLLSDTWAWNGVTWVQMAATATNPPPREAAAMAYDGHGQLVLFGGTGYASGSVPTTTQPPTTNTAPAPNPALTGGADQPGRAAPTRGSSNVLGSSTTATSDVTLSDTWLWTASGWVQSTSSGPSARSGATLTTDSANDTAVLFGGQGPAVAGGPAGLLADSWVWNGSTWTEAGSGGAPPARVGAASDFDTASASPLLFGGSGAQGDLSDAWLWWGRAWVEATLGSAPAGRQGAASAYDAATAQMVVFGGTGGGGPLGATGLISLVPPSPPAPTTPPTTTARPPAATHAVAPVTTTVPKKKVSTTPSAHPKPTPTSPPTTATVPVLGATLRTSEDRLRAAAPVWLSGSGFAPGALVTLTFHSAPALLGQITAGRNGSFRIQVTVPAFAATGQHHFVAEGMSAKGSVVGVDAAVTVVRPGHERIPLSTTLAMVGLALVIPLAAYLAMAVPGARRRHRPPAP